MLRIICEVWELNNHYDFFSKLGAMFKVHFAKLGKIILKMLISFKAPKELVKYNIQDITDMKCTTTHKN